MNTTIGNGGFSRALLLGEDYEDEVISLADNFGPFKPLLESEREMENQEETHGANNQIDGELAPLLEDGFEFPKDTSLLNYTPPYMDVFNSVLLLDEKHEGKLASVDNVFGSFESEMLLESQGVMDSDGEHNIPHPIQEKLAVRTEDEKNIGVGTIHQEFQPFQQRLLSKLEGDEDQHRIG
jgi:hypothetical protein